MKFIYFANNVYDKNLLKKNISVINDKIKKDKNNLEFIVYGGNQIVPDIKITDEDYNLFFEDIDLLDKSVNKYILFGNLYLNNMNYLKKSINTNNTNIFLIDSKLVNSNTLVLFINNQLTDANLKYLIQQEPTKYNNDMTIRNLVELEIKNLDYIFKANNNVDTIIFITQTSIFVNEEQETSSTELLQWINKNFYSLSNYKLNFICSSPSNENELSNITILKKDMDGNQISKLNLFQYIVGTIVEKNNYSNIDLDVSDNNEQFDKKNFKLEVGIDGIDTKWIFDINYKIITSDKKTGYLECLIDEKPKYLTGIFNFIDTNNVVEEKKTKINKLKKALKNKNILEPKIFDNIELSIQDSDYSLNEQLTEEGDPYKEKYIKYKKKLYKLRNKK